MNKIPAGRLVFPFLCMVVGLVAVVSMGGCRFDEPQEETGSVSTPTSVDGFYSQTDTNCPDGTFDDIVEIVQNDFSLTILPRNPGYVEMSASMSEDGRFETDGSCSGEFVSDRAVVTCIYDNHFGSTCQMTYEKIDGEYDWGTFLLRPEKFTYTLGRSADEELCNSSCGLAFTSPIKMVEDFGTGIMTMRATGGALLYADNMVDRTFDIAFPVYAGDRETEVGTMSCSGTFTSACDPLDDPYFQLACSSTTLGDCKVFFEPL